MSTPPAPHSQAATANLGAPPSTLPFDLDALQAWMHAHIAGFDGPLTVQRFKGGQSNPTFRLDTPSRNYVMRSKPGPKNKLLASAHAIEREFQVMQALHRSSVPVPQMHALCEDEGVIGRAFYIMEYLPGNIHWDPALPGMSCSERGAHYNAMNNAIAALHTVDFRALGLGDWGKPGNYFERQIARWSKQYQASVTEPIAEMDRLMRWLPDHIPAMARDERMVSIVHGDFRLDNLMFAPQEPRIMAVLDWELATLGHPLADFSYHCMVWHIPPGVFRGLAGLDCLRLGIPNEEQYITQYCDRTQLATPEQLLNDWNFYLAYNLFRIAAILQGIAKRVVEGTASNTQAQTAAAGARPLAQLAWEFAQRHTH